MFSLIGIIRRIINWIRPESSGRQQPKRMTEPVSMSENHLWAVMGPKPEAQRVPNHKSSNEYKPESLRVPNHASSSKSIKGSEPNDLHESEKTSVPGRMNESETPSEPESTNEPKLNRHERRSKAKIDKMRRKFEKARMKHDICVKPQGPEPIHYSHAPAVPREPTPAEPLPFDDDKDPNQRLIVDEWIHGTGDYVLFEESEFQGVYSFRDTILTQLERYWVYIERMKRHDRDAYEFYKRLGAAIVPYLATRSNWEKPDFHKITEEELECYKEEIEVTPWFKKHWPAFGCIAWGINPLEEERELQKLNNRRASLWVPKFLYFTRVEVHPWPWWIQPMPRGKGKLYIMTVWWDKPQLMTKDRRKWGIPNTFPIWVSDDGSIIRALKTRETSNGNIRGAYDWRIPYEYKDWAKQYGLTAQLHLTHLFALATRDIEETYYATCRVEVSKGDLTAVFGIEPRRCAYFFKDRDITLDKNGRKQKIFHVVKPYVRKDGTAVPMQFRGLKEFDWAGYHVNITVPGKDHFVLAEFDVPMIWAKRGQRYSSDTMTEAEVAAWLKNEMKAGVGGR